jgi:3-carboxy-cis,cis-muconate cycloisomerase
VLFDGTYGRGQTAAALSGTAWLQALLDVEASLARATAAAGLIPPAAAARIAEACRAERFSVEEIAREAAAHATVVIPLVAALREAVGPDDRDHVHLGATSQDVLDSATMLLAGRALDALLADAEAVAAAARGLAAAHRETPVIGRTLLQQALPTSFGLRAAGWMRGVEEAAGQLAAIRDGGLPVQMGGAVGRRGPQVADLVAADLGLAPAPLPWHAVRVPVGRLAGALGVLAGVLAKIARDVTLSAQDEVGELREGGERRGGSSAMAHKRNPVAAVSVLACTRRVPGLVVTLLAGMEQEHERAAGAWQAEWGTLSDLLTLTGSATAWARDLLERLVVDPERMRRNLDRFHAASGRQGGVGDGLRDAAALIDRALAAGGEASG